MAKKKSKLDRKKTPTQPQTAAAAAAAQETDQPVPPAPAAKSAGRANTGGQEPAASLPLKGPGRWMVFGVGLFFILALQAGDNNWGAVAMAVVLVASAFGKMPQWSLRHRLSIPVLAVFAYALMSCVAGLYTRFGSFAAGESAKILCAFCIFGVILLRARDGDKVGLSAAVAAVSAAFGLISIDGSSLKVLSPAFTGFMDRWMGCTYSGLSTGYEVGVRMTGIFGNANILAGFLAFGIFLSLYLVRTVPSRWGRLGACMALLINSLSFVLAFSMGAMGMFVVSALLYLLAEGRGRRLSLFLLLVETAVVALAMTFLAFRGLGQSGGAAVLPLLAALAGGVLLWAVHEFVGLGLAQRLSAHGKAAGLVVAGLAGLLVVYLVLAVQVTGGYTLAPGESLRRSVYPEGGSYALEGDWSGAISVTVESQNQAETIMHTSTTLYKGDLADATFAVPEDAKVVFLNLYSKDGGTVERLTLTDGPALKLGYKLLPGFVANRLQGLRANENAIQRTEFFRDGLSLFAQSPIIGNGLGSVEGLVTSVQSFYYQSKYVHNHYIQVLAEMGLVGLLLFLAMLGSAALTLWRRRREGGTGDLLPALCACLGMSALHAATEAVWSLGQYQIMALVVLAMIAVYFGRPIAQLATKTAALVATAVVCLFTGIFAWFLGGHLVAEKEYEEIKAHIREQTAYSMTSLAGRDRYGWVQYKLDMAVNAADAPVEEYAQIAAEYAQDCRALKIHSVNQSLERYIYLPSGQYEELFTASREGIVQRASIEETWQGEFDLYEEAVLVGGDEVLEDIQWFADQVLLTYGQLQSYNEGRLQEITLSQSNLDFLARIQAVKDSGATGAQAAALLGLEA